MVETKSLDPDAWEKAVEKVKEVRPPEENVGIEIPNELKHYPERHWFMAAQVAEIAKYNAPTCQDYLDLARMIQSQTLVSLPAVTDTYVLLGVGARADESLFTRYRDDQDVELLSEAQLSEAYKQLDDKRVQLQSHSSAPQAKSSKERAAAVSSVSKELASVDQDKAVLDHFYGDPVSRQKMFRDYDSLRALAHSFNGRSFDIDNPTDRLEMKINMLSALRPEALTILEEVASAYQQKFGRPLPISSLVRPEQYQHSLRRVNRNAVMIDTPPHSSGLAFDIDYRYMSGAEQMFVMTELAELKRAGRIEAIRERNANFHVFAFINGVRPNDDLIAASLEKAGATPEELGQTVEDTHHERTKPKPEKSVKTKARARRR